MLYRKSQVSGRWLRAPLQAPSALHQPLSYISRSHIADVFASQAGSTVSARVSGFYLRRRAGI